MHKGYPTTTGVEQKLRENLDCVRGRIAEACARAHRDPAAVGLVAVTKTMGVEVIQALLRLGVSDIGENRVRQLVQREATIREHLAQASSCSENRSVAPRWHMIGNLQRNKVNALLESVSMIHSVDRLRLAEEISKRGAEQSRCVDVLLEVNGADEPQKAGAAVCAAAHLGEQIASLSNLRLRGLMCMAPLSANERTLRNVFSRVFELFEEMRHEYAVGEAFTIVSMGMSRDFEIAVECGSNLVRVGTALFEGIDGYDGDMLQSKS